MICDTARAIAEEAIPEYYSDIDLNEYTFLPWIHYENSNSLTDWVDAYDFDRDEKISVNTVTGEVYTSYENHVIVSHAKEVLMKQYGIDESDFETGSCFF